MQTPNLSTTLPTALLVSLASSLPDVVDDTILELSEVCDSIVTEENLDKLIKMATEKSALNSIPVGIRRINQPYIIEQMKQAQHYHVEGEDDYV